MSLAEFFGETSNHAGDSPHYSLEVALNNFWLFPKLKSLKGKRFQNVNEIQENRAVDGNWNCVRSQGTYFERD